MEQDIKVGGQKGVEIDKGLTIKVRVIEARILELGVITQRLAMFIKERPQRRFPGG